MNLESFSSLRCLSVSPLSNSSTDRLWSRRHNPLLSKPGGASISLSQSFGILSSCYGDHHSVHRFTPPKCIVAIELNCSPRQAHIRPECDGIGKYLALACPIFSS